MASRLTRRKKLAFSAGFFLVFLAALELLSRSVIEGHFIRPIPYPKDHPRIQEDPILGFRIKPGDFDGSHINQFGLRGPEIQIPKPLGCKRILMLGGSTTYGNTVSTDKAYPAVVERLLRAKNPSQCIEVINAGISGAHSYHHLVRLRHLYQDLQPDIVTTYMGWNDFGTFLWMKDNWQPETLDAESLIVHVSPVKLSLLQNSSLYRVGYTAFLSAIFFKNTMGLASTDDPERELLPPTLALKSHLRSIAEWSNEKGASLLLIKFPQLLDDSRLKDEIKAIKEMPGTEDLRFMLPMISFSPGIPTIVGKIYQEMSSLPGVSTVDCARRFNDAPLEKRVKLFDDPIHPNAEGYEWIGNCIAEVLPPNGEHNP